MRLLSGHIFPRNALNFTNNHLDFENFPKGETPGPMLTGAEKGRGWERIKGFLPVKEGEGGKGQGRGREMGGEDQRQGDLAPRS